LFRFTSFIPRHIHLIGRVHAAIGDQYSTLRGHLFGHILLDVGSPGWRTRSIQ